MYWLTRVQLRVNAHKICCGLLYEQNGFFAQFSGKFSLGALLQNILESIQLICHNNYNIDFITRMATIRNKFMSFSSKQLNEILHSVTTSYWLLKCCVLSIFWIILVQYFINMQALRVIELCV